MASRRASQLSLSCSSGGTVTALGNWFASKVCQCSSTWSRRPGTNSKVMGDDEAVLFMSFAFLSDLTSTHQNVASPMMAVRSIWRWQGS